MWTHEFSKPNWGFQPSQHWDPMQVTWPESLHWFHWFKHNLPRPGLIWNFSIGCLKLRITIPGVQTGSNNSRWLLFQTSQISKLKLKYGWIKFRKSKSNLSLDWLWYFQSFLENIIEQTIVHSWIYTRIWEENLNSNQIPCANVQIFKLKLRFYVQMYKFKHKYIQVLYASHVQFTIQDGWRK